MNVIPFTEEKKIVMIQQFRHGIQEFTWEIPGGIVDPEEVQDPSATAARELEEETGYTADSIERIGVAQPNPAIINNLCTSFVAWNTKPNSSQNFDSSEDISVKEMEEGEVFQMIQKGEIKHALVICAFYFYWAKHGFPNAS
jgi:8-oxo-dGTP pyrophosphatase MutT (NUDIX family)